MVDSVLSTLAIMILALFSTPWAPCTTELTGFRLLLLLLMTPIATLSSVFSTLSLDLISSVRIFEDLSCGVHLISTTVHARALFCSRSWRMHGDKMCSLPFHWDYHVCNSCRPRHQGRQFVFLRMMDSNFHTSGCNMMVEVMEEYSSSPYDSGWTRFGVAVISMDVLTLYATELSPPYITGHCQCHLSILWRTLLGWSWLMTRHLHHLHHLFHISAVWSSRPRVAWRFYVVNRFSTIIGWTIIWLVPAIRVQE